MGIGLLSILISLSNHNIILANRTSIFTDVFRREDIFGDLFEHYDNDGFLLWIFMNIPIILYPCAMHNNIRMTLAKKYSMCIWLKTCSIVLYLLYTILLYDTEPIDTDLLLSALIICIPIIHVFISLFFWSNKPLNYYSPINISMRLKDFRNRVVLKCIINFSLGFISAVYFLASAKSELVNISLISMLEGTFFLAIQSYLDFFLDEIS